MLFERLGDAVAKNQISPRALRRIWDFEMEKSSRYFISQTEENLSRLLFEAGTPDQSIIIPTPESADLYELKGVAQQRIKHSYRDVNIEKMQQENNKKQLLLAVEESCHNTLLEMWSAVGQHNHRTEHILFSGTADKDKMLPDYKRMKMAYKNIKPMTAHVFKGIKMEAHSAILDAGHTMYDELVNEIKRGFYIQVAPVLERLKSRIKRLEGRRDLTLVKQAMLITEMAMRVSSPEFDEASVNKEGSFDMVKFEKTLQEDIDDYAEAVNSAGEMLFERMFIVHNELNRTDIFHIGGN